LLQVAVKSKTKYNILRFKLHDFEFRNSLKNAKVGQPVSGVNECNRDVAPTVAVEHGYLPTPAGAAKG
jgi:hypothetical protein